MRAASSKEEPRSPPVEGASDQEVWSDFLALCDFGGRLAGTQSEADALTWAQARLASIPGGRVHESAAEYAGWRCTAAHLRSQISDASIACTPLLGSASTPPEGLVAEVLDLGLGRHEDFDRHAGGIAGRIVLVRHEYPFVAGHVHRRVKLALAQKMEAAGFLIAYPEPGVGPVSGSSGRNGQAGIPALGIGAEGAAALATSPGGALPRARMTVTGEDGPARTRTLILDLPGAGPDWIVLSAHVDGHPLGESAIDNATGVAVALGLARAFATHVAACARGLRICLFSAEEWALAGSRAWLAGLPPEQRARMLLNINLDSVGGASSLTALTSGFAHLDEWVRDAADAEALHLKTHFPLMANSDHANFAALGIPAFRLIAGFDEPNSNLRLLLTAADTRDKVARAELGAAMRLAGKLVARALAAPDETLQRFRDRSPRA